VADSPQGLAGQSASKRAKQSKNRARGRSARDARTVRRKWSTTVNNAAKIFLQNTSSPGADCPPLIVRTVRPTHSEAKSALGAAQPRCADGPPSEGGRSASHRQKTDRVLKLNFKPGSKPKSIQMISDEAQNSHTEPHQHHEGDPKRSTPKDRSFMIKIQKSEPNLGFSQKWQIEGFFKRNRF
jgi:hypothetical protein